MMTRKEIENTLNEVMKPKELSTEAWLAEKAQAIVVWQADKASQVWQGAITLNHTGALELYLNAQGVCAIKDFSTLCFKGSNENVAELLIWKQELESAEAFLDAAILAYRIYLLNSVESIYLLESARLFLKADLPMIALAVLKHGLKEFPASAEAYMQRAMVYAQLGWLELGLSDLDTASRFSPRNEEILAKKAELLRSCGSIGTAIRCMKLAIEIAENKGEYLELLAQWQLEVRSYRDAVLTAERAYALNPASSKSLYLMAVTQEALGKPKAIVKLFLEAAVKAGSELAKRRIVGLNSSAAQLKYAA